MSVVRRALGSNHADELYAAASVLLLQHLQRRRGGRPVPRSRSNLAVAYRSSRTLAAPSDQHCARRVARRSLFVYFNGAFTPLSHILQPVVNPGDVLVFKWGFWPHGVRKLASGTAYENCDFSGSSKVAPIRFFGYARYTVQETDAATALFFACPVPSHCRPGGMKVQVNVTPM
ncbi:unnamed protein product [Closterium sp. NIES-54]